MLSCAQTKGGRLTAADVSIYFNVDLRAAEIRHDQCVESGQAELYISQSGIKVYQFAHIISDDEKKKARDRYNSKQKAHSFYSYALFPV